ncbi:MAG: NUDIX domain-containing protein, partial [Bacteroidia bacterium]|nr:NUDIX domain-containing protein [Bacteroidia bacterium]
ERGGRVRQICPDSSCGWTHWDNPVPVVAAIVERRGKVVLVRNVGWPESWYGLVTGFLEKKESPEEGILREVKEELGLEAETADFVGLYTFYRMNQLIIAYHIRAEEGEIKIDEEEIADYKEIPIEKVKPWPAATGLALNDWLKSKGIEAEFVQFG